MPYFQLRTTSHAVVEVGGNSEAEVKAKVEGHPQAASFAERELALAWVRAFFARRQLQITKQKAEQAGDEDAADKAYELLVDAEEVEEAAKAAYVTATQPPPSSSTSAAPSASGPAPSRRPPPPSTFSSNPYADVKQEPQQEDASKRGASSSDGHAGEGEGEGAAVDDDDGFM